MSTPPLQNGAGSLFGRIANLYLMSQTSILDLSQLEFSFRVKQNEVETPNGAEIRIYNASDQTVKQLIS